MIDSILNIVNKFIPDSNQARKIALELEREYSKQMKMQSDIIKAEIKNGSGKWRVRLMYLCMFLILAYWVMYDLIPYCIVIFELDTLTPIKPENPQLWEFLKIGVGGYIASRGVEKSVAWWRKG